MKSFYFNKCALEFPLVLKQIMEKKDDRKIK